MCYRPLHIHVRNLYLNSSVSCVTNDVPCGKCESCRDDYRNMWRCRLYHELESLYSRGGIAVFLTFTYNDSTLPTYFNENTGLYFPVFDHDHVKTFLNRLKIRSYRSFGKGSYKYFIAMEYGKHTKRQHLHGLFFLEPSVNWSAFVELCRSLWKEHGFMFPKYDIHYGYIKDDKTPDLPTIRSIVKGAMYVSKYVTKDLAYFDLPNFDEFVSTCSDYKEYMPKHYQSNNIGISIMDKFNFNDMDVLTNQLSNGIAVSYSDENVPVPRYILRKLLYKNVLLGRKNVENKPLYDSLPTSLFYSIYTMLYEKKARNMVATIKKTFDRYKSLHTDFEIPRVSDYPLLVNYLLYFKNVTSHTYAAFVSHFDGDVSSMSDFSKVGFWTQYAKDNDWKRNNIDYHYTYCDDVTFIPSDIKSVASCFIACSSELKKLQTSEFKKRSDEREKMRYKYEYKYNKKLC